MKGMPIRNGYYILAQQLRGEIIRAPNTTKKFNELLFVFFIGKSDIIFSTYMYMYLENSIKSMERKRRGCSEKLIVTGENTKKPPDWKTSLPMKKTKSSSRTTNSNISVSLLSSIETIKNNS
jgi:hypothetical protein